MAGVVLSQTQPTRERKEFFWEIRYAERPRTMRWSDGQNVGEACTGPTSQVECLSPHQAWTKCAMGSTVGASGETVDEVSLVLNSVRHALSLLNQ